ncbi:MAG: hypothetical protein PHG00_08645 [Methylococcales bacterium]|nr:hypothetical protein [Methylococcales bacterium]
MKLYKPLWILILMMAATHVWAYGSSGSSKKACNKPKFIEFMPSHNAQVSAKSEFSFVASANTDPKSIIVTIKDQPVAINIKPENQVFQVKGRLPDTLTEGFARISVTADSLSGCKGSDGWLVRIIE